MSSGPEWERVERPLLERLFSLGWERLVWTERQPDGGDARSSDRDVLFDQRLGWALEKISRGPDGVPRQRLLAFQIASACDMLG